MSTISYDTIADLVESPSAEAICAYEPRELACAFSAHLPALLAQSTADNDLVEMVFDFWKAALATPAASEFAEVFFEDDERGFRRINLLKPARSPKDKWLEGLGSTLDVIEELGLAPYQPPRADADVHGDGAWEVSITGAEEGDPDLLISEMLSGGEPGRLPHSMVCQAKRAFDGGDAGIGRPREDVFYLVSEADLFGLWSACDGPDRLDLFEDAPAKLYSKENDCRTLAQVRIPSQGYRVIV